jgi:hypothetical protein
LKIGLDLAWAFWVFAALTVSLANFLNSRGNGNDNIGSLFHHFGYFLSFTALKREFISLYVIFFSPQALSTDDFISRWLSAALASPATNLPPLSQLRPKGLRFPWCLDLLYRLNG